MPRGDTLQIGSWEMDLRTGALTWSAEQFRLFGLAPTETRIVEDQTWARLPGSVRLAFDATTKALRNSTYFECGFCIAEANGNERRLLIRGEQIRVRGAPTSRLLGTVQDLSKINKNKSEVRQTRRRLRTLSGRVLQVQEEERHRLAGELHDQIGQALTAVSLSLELTKRSADETSRTKLDESKAIVDEALDQVRGLSLDLRPMVLTALGLEAALRWLIEKHTATTGIPIDLVCGMDRATEEPQVEAACFRIIQEALTNAARHANAKSILVQITRKRTNLHFLIRDDGAGFNLEAARQRANAGGSLGLLGMEERARILGGRLQIASKSDRGTTIRGWLPRRARA